MTYAFYIASIIAIAATIRVITGTHAVHALLYLVVSFLAVATIFLILGRLLPPALEVIVYAGAIMVLFVLCHDDVKPRPRSVLREQQWLTPGIWVMPAVLTGHPPGRTGLDFSRGGNAVSSMKGSNSRERWAWPYSGHTSWEWRWHRY